ncbi:MAG: zinc ABC transporter substrate-binding protein AztC [Acidimicrobiia bacterium]|nr:MAG: zinc ABC transporter substrate-binding protein AztC [Acidimicrobiia bacterium]
MSTLVPVQPMVAGPAAVYTRSNGVCDRLSSMLDKMRMVLKTPKLALLVVVVSLVGAACTSGSETVTAEGVTVVATTTILGDIAREIVGDKGSVEVLLPIGVDPHDFQPSSSQVVAIYQADLVIANGLGLEGSLMDVLDAASSDGVTVVAVGRRVEPVTLDRREPCEEDDERTCDPHVWLDPERDASIARIIGDELVVVDGSVDWQMRADEYAADLVKTDEVVADILSTIPDPSKLLVTNHDSLGYFADRYGFDVVGTVIPGGSTLAEPSSADLARMIAVINETGTTAIFTETSAPTALAEAIADEVEHDVAVIRLYTGSLGEPGSGADTLIGMLITNARLIADGLS